MDEGHGVWPSPRRDVISQRDSRGAFQQSEGADQAPLSRDDADGTYIRISILGSISAPSLNHHGPSCVNVRGLDEESGARRGLFRDRLLLLNG